MAINPIAYNFGLFECNRVESRGWRKCRKSTNVENCKLVMVFNRGGNAAYA